MEKYNIKVKDFGGEQQFVVYTKPIKVKQNRKITKDSLYIDSEISEEEEIKMMEEQKKTAHTRLYESLENNSMSEIQKRLKDYNRSLQASMNRSINMIYDYTRSNEWDYFITLTFSQDKVNDRSDYDDLTKKMSNWINRIRRDYAPELKYIMVPELHNSPESLVKCKECDTWFQKKENRCSCGSVEYAHAYHFHGLLANTGMMILNDSGKKDKMKRPIYNIGNYKFGWAEATKVSNTYKVSRYLSKYVTKEIIHETPNKKRYWASRNLEKPVVTKMSLSEEDIKKLLDGLDKNGQVAHRSSVDVKRDGYSQHIDYYEVIVPQNGDVLNIEKTDLKREKFNVDTLEDAYINLA